MNLRHGTHQMDLHNLLGILIPWVLISLPPSLSFPLFLLPFFPFINILVIGRDKKWFLLFCFVLVLASQALCLQRLGLCLPLLIDTLWRLLQTQATAASCSVSPLPDQGRISLHLLSFWAHICWSTHNKEYG